MDSVISVLKQSVEQLGLVEHLTVSYILVSLACAGICALVIYLVYKAFYRGAVYSESFAVLIVMTTIVTAFVVITIGSNLVLSLGMVGALSIVRFRSAVKDPLDVGFLFWGIAAGITSGAGLYPFSLIATAVISVIYILFVTVGRGKRTFVLVVKYDKESDVAVMDSLKKLRYKLRGKAAYGELMELTADIRLKGENASFVESINSVEGVKSAVLVEYTGD